jgi:hypothetical protein
VARFEDRLFAEIVEQHGALLAQPPVHVAAPPRVRPLRRRGPIAALGLAIAAGIAALVIGLAHNAGTSAYAVVTNPDGTVTVTIREIEGAAPASDRLAMLEVPVRVAPVTAGCPVTREQLPSVQLPPSEARKIYAPEPGPDGFSARIDPAAVPPGDTVLLTAREVRPGFVLLRELLIEGAAPSCVAPVAGE